MILRKNTIKTNYEALFNKIYLNSWNRKIRNQKCTRKRDNNNSINTTTTTDCIHLSHVLKLKQKLNE